MRIAITGSSGLIGGAVARYFKSNGWEVSLITRSSKIHIDEPVISWDIQKGSIDTDRLEGQDVVVHLAGANIAAKRWSSRYKEQIQDSRVDGTKLLSQSLAGLKQRPKVVFCASAIGFYGNHRPSVILDESCGAGEGFLADVCNQWEQAAEPLRTAGIRNIHMRFGLVLSAQGGALARMLPVFKYGLGGRIGTGRQSMSWIALDEIPRVIDYLKDSDVSGAVNFVSPTAVSNYQFTKALGKAIHRPTIVPFPSLMVNLLFGEMGQTLLLGGATVIPKRLTDSGYAFQFPDLNQALAHLL